MNRRADQDPPQAAVHAVERRIGGGPRRVAPHLAGTHVQALGAALRLLHENGEHVGRSQSRHLRGHEPQRDTRAADFLEGVEAGFGEQLRSGACAARLDA